MLDRRKLLGVGGLAGAALIVSPVWRGAAAQDDHHTPARHLGPRRASTGQRSPGFTPFAVRMPEMLDLAPSSRTYDTDIYRIPVLAKTMEILPGLSTPLLTFGGTFPGPTIRARAGRRVKVVFQNQLGAPTNVHLHGGHVAPEHDGYPMDLIAPAGSRTYEYPNTQQGATLWYHDHSHGTEAEHVYRGLHGMYIIDDPGERYLNLPSGRFDVPITLRDAQFDAAGGLVWGAPPMDRDVTLANGKPVPYFPVARRKYRFRFANAATERMFKLTLGGTPIVQIGSDGGLLPAPVTRTEFGLGSAERMDVVIDFSRHPIGAKLVLEDVRGPVMRFDVVRDAIDTSSVPSTLRALPTMPPATVTRDVTMSFDLTGEIPLGLMDGQPYDHDRIDMRVKRGASEIWNLHNADTEIPVEHTFHLHLTQFRVLDRNGQPPTADDAGRKDTVYVAPGETVRVQAHFDTPHVGKYMYHCHFMEHSAMGMMAQLEIVP
ncbi:multicopper oxidase family protein [Actinokineospora sp. HUAS TT18]|uniref:multicopper oxidase family protein n=1 Tax=Actinokineospora sp. HUAS TT18 TaxID=3447451 RepID=UPI003F521144